MKTWDAWAPYILPNVSQCPVPVMEQELRMAAREFFAQTKDWQAWTDPTLTRTGQRLYDIEAPYLSEVAHVDAAQMDGRQIALLNWRSLGRPVSQAGAHVGAAPTSDLLEFELSADPGDGQSVRLQVTCIPSMTAPGLDDALALRHFDALKDGALARLLMLHDYGFYDPQRAGVAAMRFDKAKGQAQYRAYRNNSTAMPRARPKFF